MAYTPVPQQPVTGNWICGKCGRGNYSYEIDCKSCNAPKT